jgi:uncharacterized protein
MELDFQSFKKALKPEDVITSVSDLYFSPRDERCLLVEPETASWLVIAQSDLKFFMDLGLLRPGVRERGWLRLKDLSQSAGPDRLSQVEEILYSLFIRNMLTINGLNYYQPSLLWSIQKYPHYFNLHVTESCNLACRYCRVDHQAPDPMMMTVETCKKIIRRVLEEIPGEKYIIGFHGGEPLLNIKCVLEGARYAQEVAASLGKKITLSLQTNGVLLPRYAEQLKELNIEVGISLDGPEAIHNQQRIFPSGRGSFAEVMDGIMASRKAGLNPGFLAVIYNPEDYLKVARFMVEGLRARSFRLNYICYEGRARKELKFEVDRAAAFADNWLKLVDLAWEHYQQTGVWLSIDDLNLFVAHLVAKDRPHMCYRSPCGAGNSILGFGHDGRIYLCEEMVGKKQFCLGSIETPVPLAVLLDESEMYSRVKEIRKVENVRKCASCPWRRFHGSGCLNKSYEFFEDAEHEDPLCYYYRQVFEELMWKLSENSRLVNLISYYRKYVKIIYDEFKI